jgi:hypothetical protein
MAGLVNRPPIELAHRHGLLRKDHFQVSYVTNDIERAKNTFAERYGISKFASLGGPMPDGGSIAVAFAWVGGTLYEIIQASGPKTEFYNRDLPTDRFAIRFHHLGFLVHDQAAWRQLEREIKEGKWTVAYTSLNSGFMDAYYVEAPELGHYLEFIYPQQAGVAFFESVPAS